MEALLLYFGKMILCSAVMFGYYHLALKNRTFHHYNRFYLLSVVVVSVLLPLLKVSYFTIEVNSDIYRLFTKFSSVNQTKTDNHDFIYYRLIIFLFGLASVLILGRFFIGILKIRTFRRRFPKEEIEGISFYQTNLESAPFSFFRDLFWKNSIPLNSDLGRQILKHEMVHIEQKHTYDKVFMELATGIFWINPIFWLIKKEINLIHEYLADNKAVKHMDTKAFAQMLLASHFSGTVIPATSPFLSSNLKKRLKMLQKPKTRFGYAHRILALPIVFSLAFIYMVNAKNKEIEKTKKVIEAQLSGVKQDTVKKSVNATLVEVKGGEAPNLLEAKNASEQALFIIEDKEVSKQEYLDFLERNKGNTQIVTSKITYSPKTDIKQTRFGERGKFGVYRVQSLSREGKNGEEYRQLIKKYNPEGYESQKEELDKEDKILKGSNLILKTGEYFESVFSDNEKKIVRNANKENMKSKIQETVNAAKELNKTNDVWKVENSFQDDSKKLNVKVKIEKKKANNELEAAELASEKAALEVEKAELARRQAELVKKEVALRIEEANKSGNFPNVKVYTAYTENGNNSKAKEYKVTSSFNPNSTETVGSVIGAMEKSEQQKNYKILSPEMKVYVDGKEVPYSSLEKMSPKLIKSVHVNKKDYNGEKNYTMYIETK